MPANTFNETVSWYWSPWVDNVDTVAEFLFTIPDKIFAGTVFKLWFSPVPTPTKYNVSTKTLLLIPTNEPVDPRPTLAVAIPTRSSEIFAAYKVCPFSKANVSIPSVETPIESPP